MKKCLSCGSISNDDRRSCGVCGTSLAGFKHVELEENVAARNKDYHHKSGHGKKFYCILGGIFLIPIALAGLYLMNFGLISLILPGLILIMIGTSADGMVEVPEPPERVGMRKSWSLVWSERSDPGKSDTRVFREPVKEER